MSIKLNPHVLYALEDTAVLSTCWRQADIINTHTSHTHTSLCVCCHKNYKIHEVKTLFRTHSHLYSSLTPVTSLDDLRADVLIVYIKL